MKTTVVGHPRIGKNRELKFASEKFFRSEITEVELLQTAAEIRKENLLNQKSAGIDYISSNDFSLYDNVLDAAYLFNIIPNRYKELELSDIETFYAMARGYQGDKGNVKALAMKKWFNTNYHYIVPEIDDNTEIKLNGNKPVNEFTEAKSLGVDTKVDIVGPFTLLKLARYTGHKTYKDFVQPLISSYTELFDKLSSAKAQWIQIDEPALVKDLTKEDLDLFNQI